MFRAARLLVLLAAACSSASPPRSNDRPVAAPTSTHIDAAGTSTAIDLGAEPGGELPAPPPTPSAAQVQEAWAALLARFKEEKLSGFVLVQQEAPRWMSVKAAKAEETDRGPAPLSHGRWQQALVVFQVVSDEGEFVVLESARPRGAAAKKASNPDVRHCAGSRDAEPFDRVDLRFVVRRDALVPVVVEARSETFADGSAYVVDASAPVSLDGVSPVVGAPMRDERGFAFPLEGFKLGLSYSAYTWSALPEQTFQSERVRVRETVTVGQWKLAAPTDSGVLCTETGICRFSSRCASIDAVATDRVPYLAPPFGGEGGIGYGSTGCQSIEGKSGTTLYWEDGSKAGELTGRVWLSSSMAPGFGNVRGSCPSKKGARTCFYLPPLQNPLCADTSKLQVIKGQ
jgi:hypothetical protein